MEYNLHDTSLKIDILSAEEKEIWDLYMKVLTSAGLGDVSEWMKLDMSMPQMKILMLLNNHGSLKVSEIADSTGASLSNTTGLLDRLEAAQFITRTPSELDRRSIDVRLTGNAEAIFRGLYEKGHHKIQQSLRKMTDAEKEMVKQGLTLLSITLKDTE